MNECLCCFTQKNSGTVELKIDEKVQYILQNFLFHLSPHSEKVPEDLLKLRQGETSLPYCGQQLQKTAITTMIREEEQILQILALKSGKLSW
jgi:hypothetical protein